MAWQIIGGRRLEGEHRVQGAKNSALPILAACACVRGECVIRRCPALSDVQATLAILEHLGCKVTRRADWVAVDARAGLRSCAVPDHLMRAMRSSIVFLGPLLVATGEAELSAPGGCEIGQRPIDLHLDALRALGVQVHEGEGRLHCRVEQKLRAARITLRFPSVGATENIMIAASVAKGTTVLTNAAREPEIVDLAEFLNTCGARIHGAGQGTVVIEGVASLHGGEHTVIADRIAAATYLCAAAITQGEIHLLGCNPGHMDAVLMALEAAGCRLRRTEPNALWLRMQTPLRHLPALRTQPYPGFPTDAQAAMLALASVAGGTSFVTETIFENRFGHAEELRRMGAQIQVEGRVARVEGVQRLHGAELRACDLRAGAALVVAALAAEGQSVVSETRHVQRGLQQLDAELARLGASITRAPKATKPKAQRQEPRV